MEAGVPTVAFNRGPFPEMIEHGRTGWLCDDVTPVALADGLAQFVGAREYLLELADVVRASAQSFSVDRFGDQWWSVFQGASSVRRTPRVETPISVLSRRM
jgi:glycogen(starch) synthase